MQQRDVGESSGISFGYAKVPSLPANLAHLQQVVDRLMAKDPKERYGSGIKLVVDLQPYVDATLERSASTFHGEPSSQPKMASAGIGRPTTYP